MIEKIFEFLFGVNSDEPNPKENSLNQIYNNRLAQERLKELRTEEVEHTYRYNSLIKIGDYFAQFNEDLYEGYNIIQIKEIFEDYIVAEGITIGPADLRIWSGKLDLLYWTQIESEDAEYLFDLSYSVFAKVNEVIQNANSFEYDQFKVGNCYRSNTKEHTIIYKVTEYEGNKKFYELICLYPNFVSVEGSRRINKLEVNKDILPINPDIFDNIKKLLQIMMSSARPIVKQKYGLYP